MPALSDYTKVKPLKMLVIGASGRGKTGGLASLAQAGFNLRILDYDNGLSPLVENLAEADRGRVVYETLTDKLKMNTAGAIVADGLPTAWQQGLRLMTQWKTPEYDLGSPQQWTRKEILVIDTLTRVGQASLRRVKFINGRNEKPTEIQDYGTAMEEIEKMLQFICSDSMPCNVIVNSHVNYLGGDEDGVGAVGYPASLGKQLCPKIASYFDVCLLADVIGNGSTAKRVFRTVPFGAVEVKSPHATATELPIKTGLADYFKAAGIKPN